jgi:hypothetical protein
MTPPTYTVRWLGRYRQECNGLEAAQKFARLVAQGAAGWSADQQKAHPRIIVENQLGGVADEIIVADFLAQAKADEEARAAARRRPTQVRG